jgi:hypothetical protein
MYRLYELYMGNMGSYLKECTGCFITATLKTLKSKISSSQEIEEANPIAVGHYSRL